MCARLAALAGLICISIAVPAMAAPTCLRLDGLAARCHTLGAMPVGWQPSPEQMLVWRQSRPTPQSGFEMAGAFALMAALATLIAAMPPFDGWNADDWDEQEGEHRGRQGRR